MHPTAHISLPQAPPADHPALDADPGIEAGVAIAVNYLPIAPFLLLVALTILAFVPAFAVIALVAVACAILALPFLAIRRLVKRG